MWSAIEEIKNGMSYDKRYHGRMRYFDPPTVWCFTNSFPDMRVLSQDRWRFYMISATNELYRVDWHGNRWDEPDSNPEVNAQDIEEAERMIEEAQARELLEATQEPPSPPRKRSRRKK